MSLITKVLRNASRSVNKFRRLQISQAMVNNGDPKRVFSTSFKLSVKMFKEHENTYAYNVMKSRGYAMVDLDTVKNNCELNQDEFKKLIEQDWSQVPPKDLFEIFPKFGAYCTDNNLCISDTMFDTFIDQLTDGMKFASDEELVSIFYALCQWPEPKSVRTRNFIEVWAALDETCLQRMSKWSIDELLSFISLFYMINVTKGTQFFKKALNRLATKAKRLTPEQLVKTLFFVGIIRNQPFDMHNLEVQLSNNFNNFSVDDLAVMSMGFFKSKTPIRDVELVKKIIKVLMANTETINDVSLTALLKIIRYSMTVPYPDNIQMVNELLDKLTVETTRLSNMSNVHIALLCASKLTLHNKSLDAVALRVTQNMSSLRLKDIERLVLSYGTFNYTPNIEGFFDKLMDELRKPEREMEILNHGKTFACCISFITLLNIYPLDLMDTVLSKDFLTQIYGKNCYNYGKEILIVDNIAELFCKNEIKNRLTEKESIVMAKKYTDFMPTDDFKKQYNFVEKMILDINNILCDMRGGKQYVVGDHILTHHQRGDIILCDTHDGAPLPIKEEYFKTFGLIRRLPDNNKWTVLILCGRNGLIYGTQTPTGQFQAKLKELRSLGYNANLILWNVYSKLESREDKIKYLKEVINTAT